MIKKILIVDDEEDLLQTVGRKLTLEGFDVIKARDGQEAISLAKRFLPDLILMDVVMPELDGPEAVKQLRENNTTKTIPIIFMTGILSKNDNVEEKLGVSISGYNYEYITKPFDFDELMVKIKTGLKVKF